MRTVVFGGSFNPAGVHHREIATLLSKMFDRVKIVVCGPRPDKPTTNDIEPVHRAAIADLTFGSIGQNVEVDLSDLERKTFTRTHVLDARYAIDGEVWHLVGTDLVAGGRDENALIQRVWEHGTELWKRLNFVVALRDGITFDERDLPPKHILLHTYHSGASEEIRRRATNHQLLENLATPEARDYIVRHGLYRGISERATKVSIPDPRLLIVANSYNGEALALAERLVSLENRPHPNLIVSIGGDGTMLHAIKDNWRLRLPFFGVNTGHLGFLLNDVKREIDDEFFKQEFVGRSSPLLHVRTEHPDGSAKERLAFNDAWAQPAPGKTGWFEVRIDDEPRIPRLMGDGVLVSTAAGSTAYARAMGANPLPLGTDLLIVVGSNVAEPLHWRTGANLPIESVVEFRSADKTGYRKIYGFVDGESVGEITSMRIRKSFIAAAELAFLYDHDIRRKVALTQFP